jgi:hypothetical protein
MYSAARTMLYSSCEHIYKCTEKRDNLEGLQHIGISKSMAYTNIWDTRTKVQTPEHIPNFRVNFIDTNSRL